MVASLEFRKNEANIRNGIIPDKYLRIIPHIPGQKILEVGSAEGVLSLLLAKEGRDVVALERQFERHTAAIDLAQGWKPLKGSVTFSWGDIIKQPQTMDGVDTLVAIRMIYYLGDDLDHVFRQAAKRGVQNIVLCGNRNRANRWRSGEPNEPGKPRNFYASREGMRSVLERHGYTVVMEVTEGDEIVVGRMDRPEPDPVQDQPAL